MVKAANVAGNANFSSFEAHRLTLKWKGNTLSRVSSAFPLVSNYFRVHYNIFCLLLAKTLKINTWEYGSEIVILFIVMVSIKIYLSLGIKQVYVFQYILKYGSQEMGSWFYRCSPLLVFIMSKKLRGLWFCLLIKVQNATSLVFFTW